MKCSIECVQYILESEEDDYMEQCKENDWIVEYLGNNHIFNKARIALMEIERAENLTDAIDRLKECL